MTSKMKKADICKWFESCNGMTRGGITVSIRAEYGKKAYIGEYSWSGGYGVNMRWSLELSDGDHHYHTYASQQDVQGAVSQGLDYCLAVKRMVEKK